MKRHNSDEKILQEIKEEEVPGTPLSKSTKRANELKPVISSKQ